MRIGYPAVQEVTDMATSVKTALISIANHKQKTNGTQRVLRVLMLTPYMDEVHSKNVQFFETCDTEKRFEIVYSDNLGFPSDEYTTAVHPEWILKKLKEVKEEF